MPEEELRSAIEAAPPAGEWIPHEQVIEAVARHLGFAQLWRGIRAPIDRAIHPHP